MSRSSWIRALRKLSARDGSTASGARRRSPRAPSPRYELLEERAVPAVLSTFLTTEHVDLSIGHMGGAAGAWSLQPRDSDIGGVSYAPDDALLYVGDNGQSLITRPADAAFDFTGVAAGESFYRLPQSQDPELLYLGVAGYGVSPSTFDRYNPAAESMGRISGLGRWLKMSLVDVRHVTPEGQPGDGVFSAWQSGDTGPNVFMSSFDDSVSNPNAAGLDATDGIGANDAVWVVAGGHIHYNWGFTERGRYEVTVKLSGRLDDGDTTEPGPYVESDPITLYFSVGSVGELEFDSSSYTVDEAAGVATIGVRRVGGSDGRISVKYETSDGTASAGSDYTVSAGTLTFNDGETYKTITVPILDDGQVEPDETVNLVLTEPGPASIDGYYVNYEADPNGLLGSRATATLTILGNDAPPPNTPPTVSDVAGLTVDEDTPTTVDFSVGDAETPPGSLVVAAASSNAALVPAAGLVLGGSGSARTLTITPAANQFGSTTITLTVTDGNGATVTDTFVLTVHPVNDPPAISDIPDQSAPRSGMAGPLSFTVGDVETPAGSLLATGSSSNTALVPNANIVFGGSGASRTVTVTPAAGQSGTATITVTVTDADGGTATDTFVLTVSANTPPTISDVADQATDEGAPRGVNFTVGDAETPIGSLVVTATSSNTALVPNANLVLSGSGADRTLTITPAADLSGVATITLIVTDGDGATIADTFVLVVNAPPVVGDVADRFVTKNTSAGPIAFTVGDAETSAAGLIVTATSSNTALVPNASLVLGGSGADRTLTITPAADQLGSTVVTVTVTDAAGSQSRETFVLIVTGDALVPFAMPAYHGGGLATASFNSVAADFNGDGRTDLISAGSGINALGYLQGTGDGGFLPERGLNVGLNLSAQGVVGLDYDSDGDVDLIALEYDQATRDGTADEGTISLYRNDGTGQFSRVVLRGGLAVAYQLAAGDFNGDGRPDLAYNKGATAVAYALQLPSGELGADVALPAAIGRISGVLVGDVNGDGKLDIVAGDSAGARLLVFPGHGDGSFGEVQSVATGSYPTVHELADMNGDGRLDVVVADRVDASRVGYYPQLAGGSWSFGDRVGLLPGIVQLNSLLVADVNQDGVPDVVSSVYSGAEFSVNWTPGLGGGAYGDPLLIAQHPAYVYDFQVVDLDGDSHPDVVAAGNTSIAVPGTVAVFMNKTGENPMVLLPPAPRGYVAGDQIDVQVYFGFPIAVTGSPRIALQLGAGTVYANYVAGSGTPTLRFRYTVTATDVDLDGVQLASSAIDLNGGALKNPINGDAVLEFPNLTFGGVIVNGAGPLVQGITRLDATPTAGSSVRFQVQFAGPVTGVDASDFEVVMNAGDLAGAGVLAVTGSGGLYEVTVSTGTGSGTLGLAVKGSASIFDLDGDVLGKGYAGGQVYTLQRSAPKPIDAFYTEGHGDYRPVWSNGEFSYVLRPDAGLLPKPLYQSNEVYTYLDSTAVIARPEAASYDFLGVAAGAPLYQINSSGSIATVPYLGFSGESLVPGAFAAYVPADPRITSSTPQAYLKVQMVDMRSSSGGHFSLYSISSGNPRVWMASSDGLGDTDHFWQRSGSHSHFNVAFSKPGVYEVDVVISGYLDSNGNGVYDPIVDPYIESGVKTMVFGVDFLGARDDAYTVHGRNSLHGSVTMNDEWHDGLGEATASVVTITTKGSLSLQPDGSFSYAPSAAFDGTDSFVYRLTNPRGGSTTATVTITAAGSRDFNAVLQAGHTDVGVAFEDGEWDLHVHDGEHDAEYEPAEALLYVGPQALTARTGGLAGPAFDFLGVAAGQTFYSLPQTPNPELLFLGIGAEELGDGVFSGDAVTVRLKAVNGPGHFSLWQSGDLGPAVAMATSDGITFADQVTIQAGSHAHYHWGFSARGRYEVTFEALATLPDGTAVFSGDVTYYFSVDHLGRLQFDSPTYSVGEDGVVTVTVHRTDGSDGPLAVEYAAAGGTATPGVDYAPFGGVLTFLDGETEKTLTIVISPDAIAEGDETVGVSLVAPEGSPTRLGSPSEAILTIVDDDPPVPADGVISGYVFIDSSNDGLRDPGEAGVADVRLVLTGSDDLGPIEPRAVLTGADGSYRFEGLRPGTYRIAEVQPGGLLDGQDSRGSSGVLPDSHRSDVVDGIALPPSGSADAINFGELRPGRIGGSVYEDLDGDGLRRDGEPGVPGVIVTLTGTDDLGPITPRSIRTDADGGYWFDDLRPGSYTVDESQPSGFVDGFETRGNVAALPGSSSTDAISLTLAPGQTLVENHFGEVRRPLDQDPTPEPASAVVSRIVNRRSIVLFFGSPIDAARASASSSYRLTAVGAADGAGSRNGRAVLFQSASYNAGSRFVRLTLAPRFRLADGRTYRLEVDRQVAGSTAGLVSEDGSHGNYTVLFRRGRAISVRDADGDRVRFAASPRSVLELHSTSGGEASRLYVQGAAGETGGLLRASIVPGPRGDGRVHLPLLDGAKRYRSNPPLSLTVGRVVPRAPIVARR